MRKGNVFSSDPKAIIPRMSWSAKNLYNLLLRSTNPFHMGQLNFTRTALTMYQQRWRSKRFLRGYHGDWIPERRFKRWFLPDKLPRFDQRASLVALDKGKGRALRTNASGSRMPFNRSRIISEAFAGKEIGAEERMPTASLFMRDVERRLDVAVFRCCFAKSAYQARGSVVQGHVKLNGVKVTDPNTLLQPGDLISVDAKVIPMLDPKAAEKAKALSEKKAREDQERRQAQLEEIAEKRGDSSTSVAGVQEEGQGEQATKPAQEEGQGSVAAESSETGEVQAAAVEGEQASQEKSAETTDAESKDAQETKKVSQKQIDKGPKSKDAELPAGVLPFTLPFFAAPFLFIPPYLEVSFATCSAVYMRHPTIVPVTPQQRAEADANRGRSPAPAPPYRTDIPSPYSAGGDMFSMAWEHYARDAPRTRGDLRRLKVEAAVGRNGFESARAKDAYKTLRAIRRGKASLVPSSGGSGRSGVSAPM